MSNDLPAHMRPERSFQGLILALQRYWADYGCVILQPYDMEMGAGTFHPATTLRALGPKPWNAAYVQPSRRPKDGRYGENPNRLQHYYQFQVILKPSPPDLQDLYLKSLYAIGIDPKLHDLRFVEDDWESPTLGAWGLGWECWCDGMEVSQFTYFQQVAGFECAPVAGELTYGLERLAMYVQGVDRVFDLNFNGRDGAQKVTYGDVFLQAEKEYSRHNFEYADTDMLFAQFKMAEAACQKYLDAGWIDAGQHARPPDGAAGLRPVHQGEPRVQPARRARRDLGDRAAELHSARARTRQGVRRGVARDRGRGRRLSPRQRLILRIVFLAAAALSFVFAVFVWLNIDSDLSAENFAGEAFDFVRYVWVEINLMLVALLVGALALLIALRENLLSWRARSRKSGGENDQHG